MWGCPSLCCLQKALRPEAVRVERPRDMTREWLRDFGDHGAGGFALGRFRTVMAHGGRVVVAEPITAAFDAVAPIAPIHPRRLHARMLHGRALKAAAGAVEAEAGELAAVGGNADRIIRDHAFAMRDAKP